MSYFTEHQAAAAEAQEILAQIQGKGPGVGNVQFVGHPAAVVGVFGSQVVTFAPQPGGGYRRKTELPLSVTRAQLAAAPLENTTLVRLDVTPPITYVIQEVNRQDPLRWEFRLVNFTK